MTTDCVHYFLLALANGPISVGICQKCGEERDHYNFFGHHRDFGNHDKDWLSRPGYWTRGKADKE